MHVISIYSLIVLVTTASARPAKRAALASGQALQITNLNISDTSTANTTFSFNAYDPDPLTDATATCTGTWKHDNTSNSNPQSSYELCGNTTFAWNFLEYTSVEAFTLRVEHRFTDPSVGDPPYDQVTNFAQAPVNISTSIDCQVTGVHETCQQKNGVIIYAKVYATSA